MKLNIQERLTLISLMPQSYPSIELCRKLVDFEKKLNITKEEAQAINLHYEEVQQGQYIPVWDKEKESEEGLDVSDDTQALQVICSFAEQSGMVNRFNLDLLERIIAMGN